MLLKSVDVQTLIREDYASYSGDHYHFFVTRGKQIQDEID
jgi:hypothetical protein